LGGTTNRILLIIFFSSRVSLAQLVRFLEVELIYQGLNPIFNMGVVFISNYSFSGRRRPRRHQGVLGDQLRESQDQVGSVFRRCSYE
jgi:hypothetical protein